jgi:hypothetical protein
VADSDKGQLLDGIVRRCKEQRQCTPQCMHVAAAVHKAGNLKFVRPADLLLCAGTSCACVLRPASTGC